MIRRSDITVSDTNNTPEPGVWITVKHSDGTIAPIYNDNGTTEANPFQSGAGGVFVYNVTVDGTYIEEYRINLTDSPQRIIAVSLSSSTAASQIVLFTSPANYNAGAIHDGTTDDSAAFSALQTYRIGQKITGYGYGPGYSRAYVPSGVSNQGTTPLDLYGAGILQGDSGGIAGGGTSVLLWGANAEGIRVQFADTANPPHVTSGDTTVSTTLNLPSASGTILRSLSLYSSNTGSDATKPGIRIKAPVTIEDVFINGFAGDGITANCQLSGFTSAFGNASSSQIHRCWVQNCLTGFKLQGADASIAVVLGCSAVANRSNGFADYSEFGNLWIGLHAASNAGAPYFTDPAQSSAHPTLIHCYEEGGQPQSTFSQGTLVVGGNWVNYPSGGGYLYANGNRVRVNDFASDGNITASGVSSALGPTTGAASDSALYLENTNINSYMYFRSWSAGSPTTHGYIGAGSGSIKINGTTYQQFYIGGTRVMLIDSGGLKLDINNTIQINSQQVVGARNTGWTADTGTARKASNATYTAGTTLTYSATYVQSEQTAMATRMSQVEAALQNATQTIMALKAALTTHGLIGT